MPLHFSSNTLLRSPSIMFSNLPITKYRSDKKFMEPLNDQPYYEDLYGKRNSDEFDEGSVHSCAPETSDEDISKPARKPPSNRFFQQFTTPRRPSTAWHSDRFGEIKKPGEFDLPR